MNPINRQQFIADLKATLESHVASNKNPVSGFVKWIAPQSNLATSDIEAQALLDYINSGKDLTSDKEFATFMEQVNGVRTTLKKAESETLLRHINQLLFINGVNPTYGPWAKSVLAEPLSKGNLTTESINNNALKGPFVIPENKDLSTVQIEMDRVIKYGGLTINGISVSEIAGYTDGPNGTVTDDQRQKVYNIIDRQFPDLIYLLRQGIVDEPGLRLTIGADIYQHINNPVTFSPTNPGYNLDIAIGDDGQTALTETYRFEAARNNRSEEMETQPLADPLVVTHKFEGTRSADGKSFEFKSTAVDVKLASEPDKKPEQTIKATIK